MAKVTIEQLYKNDKRKDGTPYVNKFGKPYTLHTVVAEDRRFTVWGTPQQLADLQVGDTIEGEITENNGFYSINLPKPVDPKIQEILDRLTVLEEAVFSEKKVAKEVDEFEPDPEDIPF